MVPMRNQSANEVESPIGTQKTVAQDDQGTGMTTIAIGIPIVGVAAVEVLTSMNVIGIVNVTGTMTRTIADAAAAAVAV